MKLSELTGTTIVAVRRDSASLLIDFSNGCQLLIAVDPESPGDHAADAFYAPTGEHVVFDPEEVPDLWPYLGIVKHA